MLVHPAGVVLRTSLSDDLPPVLGDRLHLQQPIDCRSVSGEVVGHAERRSPGDLSVRPARLGPLNSPVTVAR